MISPAHLVDLQSGNRILIFPQIQFGRLEECEVRIPDKSISRKHATLEKRGEQYIFTDLGSANGSLINGAAVQGENSLQNGDRIQIGEFVFELQLPSANAGDFIFFLLDLWRQGEGNWTPEEETFLRENGIPSCSQWMENHQGEVLRQGLDRWFVLWEGEATVNRLKAVASARTALLGIQKWRMEKGIPGMAGIGARILIHRGKDPHPWMSLRNRSSLKSEGIWMTPEFLSHWPDAPPSEESLRVEGIEFHQAKEF
jgi:hypothetical protein